MCRSCSCDSPETHKRGLRSLPSAEKRSYAFALGESGVERGEALLRQEDREGDGPAKTGDGEGGGDNGGEEER